jgi:CTP-dependent riboflavin kinase
MEFKGKVSGGLGRAHKFMAQPHYQEQFEVILGAYAWPGTLNVKVEGDDLGHYLAIRERAGIDTLDVGAEIRAVAVQTDVSALIAHRVRPFLREGRSFGGATAFLARCAPATATSDSVACAILIPDLTQHVDVIEVIATVQLREALRLEDGAVVVLQC